MFACARTIAWLNSLSMWLRYLLTHARPHAFRCRYLRVGLMCKLYPLYDVSSTADVGSLLRIGHFIQKFSKMLHLTPFSFLSLQKALLHPRATALMTELHVSLLLTLLRGHMEAADSLEEVGCVPQLICVLRRSASPSIRSPLRTCPASTR